MRKIIQEATYEYEELQPEEIVKMMRELTKLGYLTTNKMKQ
jgi:hypothetical protein